MGKPGELYNAMKGGSLKMTSPSYLRGRNIKPIAKVGGKAVGKGYKFKKKRKAAPLGLGSLKMAAAVGTPKPRGGMVGIAKPFRVMNKRKKGMKCKMKHKHMKSCK